MGINITDSNDQINSFPLSPAPPNCQGGGILGPPKERSMRDHILTEFAPIRPAPSRPNGPPRGAPAGRRQPWFDLPRSGKVGRISTQWISLWVAMRTAWRRHRSRRCLLELNADLRKDIGVSYAEAEAEGNKPFWVD
jgi:uncharacterized protein YjiS (DUF1127 family)